LADHSDGVEGLGFYFLCAAAGQTGTVRDSASQSAGRSVGRSFIQSFIHSFSFLYIYLFASSFIYLFIQFLFSQCLTLLQTFLGLKLPPGCPSIDYLDGDVFDNDTSDSSTMTVKASERDPEFQMNDNGDFECIFIRPPEEITKVMVGEQEAETKDDFDENRNDEKDVEKEEEMEKDKKEGDTVREMVREKDKKEKIKAKERELKLAWEKEKTKGKDLRDKEKEKDIDGDMESREKKKVKEIEVEKEREKGEKDEKSGEDQEREEEVEVEEEEDSAIAEDHDAVGPIRMISLRRNASTPISIKGMKSERRVSFENFLRIDRMQGKNEESFRERRKGRETDKEPLLQLSVIDRHRSSEFHAKYEEIVGAKKDCGRGGAGESRRAQSERIGYHKPSSSLEVIHAQRYWNEDEQEKSQGQGHEQGEARREVMEEKVGEGERK
jgi:hypothetical protein